MDRVKVNDKFAFPLTIDMAPIVNQVRLYICLPMHGQLRVRVCVLRARMSWHACKGVWFLVFAQASSALPSSCMQRV